jgi:methanogen homoaconitase small subunit
MRMLARQPLLRPGQNSPRPPSRGDIIIATENFGCGSSREYAVDALRRRKVGAIIALSFARIFFRNALNLGIPLYVAPGIVNSVQDGEDVALDLAANHLVVSGRVYDLPILPFFAREILATGGIVNYVKQHGRFPGES